MKYVITNRNFHYFFSLVEILEAKSALFLLGHKVVMTFIYSFIVYFFHSLKIDSNDCFHRCGIFLFLLYTRIIFEHSIMTLGMSFLISLSNKEAEKLYCDNYHKKQN